MTTVAVNILLPRSPDAYAAALAETAPVTYVLTPRRDACDAGVCRLLTAYCAAHAMADGMRAVIVTPSASRMRRVIERCSPKTLIESRTTGEWRYKTGGEIAVVRPDQLADVTFSGADLVVLDCYDQLEREHLVAAQALHGRVMLVGHPVGDEHALYHGAMASESKAVHRISWQDAVELGSWRTWTAPEVKTSADRTKWLACDPAREDPPPLHVYSRQRLKVRTKSGDIVRFAMWPDQLKYLAERRLARMKARAAGRTQTAILVLKSRRRGITTIEQADSYQISTMIPESRCLTLAQTDKDTRAIFDIARRFQRLDEDGPPMPGPGNQTVLKFPSLNSKFFVTTAGAKAPARGETLTKVHGSEVSRWCNSDPERVAELMSGLTEATSHGTVVLETTPAGKEWFYEQWMDSKRGANDWHRIFLRWFDDPSCKIEVDADGVAEIKDTMDDEEASLLARFGLSLEQIAWRRAAKRRLRVLFYQEYPEDDETCFLAAGTTYFTMDTVVERLRKMDQGMGVSTSVRTAHGRGTKIVYKKPEPGKKYVIGADTSEGVPGKDPCGFIVKEKDTGEDCMAVHGIFRPKDLAELIVAAHREYNDALIGVERNNHGHAVILRIKELGVKRRRHLYHFKDGRPGWDTNSESRPRMLENCADFIDSSPEKVHDVLFLQECLAFKMQKNGRFEADKGSHDDAVMKHAVALQMRLVRTGGGVRTRQFSSDGSWVPDSDSDDEGDDDA